MQSWGRNLYGDNERHENTEIEGADPSREGQGGRKAGCWT